MRCSKCVDLMAAKDLDKKAYTLALANTAFLGDMRAVRLMLDHGADVNAADSTGRTPLMYAAGSDLLPLDVVKALVERGANLNATDAHKSSADSGMTALDIAKLRGQTPVVDYLVKAGAKATARPVPTLEARKENSIRAAVAGSLPWIQKADANFMPKAACASCHNNSMAAMAVSAARSHGFPVDEKVAAQQVKGNVFGLVKLRDYLHQGIFVPVEDFFGPNIAAYMLIGLGAEHYPADLNTDAAAMYLKSHQSPEGDWRYAIADSRPPICSMYVGQTAICMRALQLYAPKIDKAGYDRAIQVAAQWLAKAKPVNNDDRTWRLMGLAWSGKDKDATRKAMGEVLASQRPDGGWGDIDSMPSTVYETGRALVALQTAGMPVTEAVYQKGVRYLLSTQLQDGSWYVKSRALGFQPFFDAGFPHGVDQFISGAGASWATIALSLAAPHPTPAVP